MPEAVLWVVFVIDLYVCLYSQVMDNILIQVVGRKKIILFKPSDLPYLYMQGISLLLFLSDVV